MNEIKTLAKYKKRIYRNDMTGFTIFIVSIENISLVRKQCKNDDIEKEVKCIGTIPDYHAGTPLYIEGKYVLEKAQIQTIQVTQKSWDKIVLADYLSNICAGIGPAKAMKIAETFDDFFAAVNGEDAANEISKKANINYETAVLLCETVRQSGLQKEVYDYIAPFGGSWSMTTKIVDKYGIHSISEIERDPYSVCGEFGMSFYNCDQIATKNSLPATDTKRVEFAINKAFQNENNKGHVYSNESLLCQAAHSVVKRSAYKEEIPSVVFMETLGLMQKDGRVIFEIDDDTGCECVYQKFMYNDEEIVAEQLHRLMSNAEKLKFDESIVEWAENSCGIKYAPQQKEAFNLIRKSGVAVITGGPGTGKTTCVNGVINAYEKLNPDKIIKLCAPTGRAAQRMAESTGREAVTIHRLLEYQPYGSDVTHKTAADPIEADLIVVDESSMLDLNLAAIFFTAVKSGALVLLIGDVNQLPSVGAGDVLNDIIKSNIIPTVQLATVYRQGKESPIIQNANRINVGYSVYVEDKDYKTAYCENAETALSWLIFTATSMFDPKDPFSTQVLCPTHKGLLGVAEINKTLQRLLNPPSETKKELSYGSKKFRVGDKVILLNNNYSVGYFNGDLGVIRDIVDGSIILDVSGKEIKITHAEIDDLSLAYAMTIHKSQGSEFPHVIISVPLSPQSMLKKNLIYTAVTRAKKSVTVVSQKIAVDIAVENTQADIRNSRLVAKTQKRFKGE